MMTYDSISKLASRVGKRLQGCSIFGLMLPCEFPDVFPWKKIDSPASWAPFETVFRTGPKRVLYLNSGMDLDRRIDAVRVLRMLRAEALFIAFGCSSPDGELEAGSCVIIEDHVNFTGENPLRGPNDDRMGPRYPNMNEPYDARWSQRLERSAASMGMSLQRAVYGRVGRSGAAEIRNTWTQAGVDVTGAGLLDEVISAVHCGLPIAAVGIVENVCPGDGFEVCSSEPALSAEFGRLAELINQCLHCRGGMDDG